MGYEAGDRVSASGCDAGAMDMNVLRKKPWMLGGKDTPVAGPEGAQPEVEVTHAKASAKRPMGSLVPDQTAAG
ncbi:hypothetical protein OPV22_009431 [Ensete ventricosum]|uniref:Uncharacterized protein n=1 Tax=Ensete ventricosum TaxID=4639 RepID=A0AAV8PSK9_ENSVE|nr:hypothetical protein OPV22_009431 [Ensete ventricosum]